MWSTIVGALLGKVAPQVAEYYIQKQSLKYKARLAELEGKIAWQKALTHRASESEGRDHEWELARIEDSGWKDEWVLFLLSIPLVLSFIPYTQGAVLEGFNALSKTPAWYQGMVVTIFFAIYGIRKWRRKTAASVLLEKQV